MSAPNEVRIELWVGGDTTPSEVFDAVGLAADWLSGAVDRRVGRDPLRVPAKLRTVVMDLESGHEENGTAALDAAVSKLEGSRGGLRDLAAKGLSMTLKCALETNDVWETYIAVTPVLMRRIADLGLTLEVRPYCFEREPSPE